MKDLAVLLALLLTTLAKLWDPVAQTRSSPTPS
jgi:hypothetical protein